MRWRSAQNCPPWLFVRCEDMTGWYEAMHRGCAGLPDKARPLRRNKGCAHDASPPQGDEASQKATVIGWGFGRDEHEGKEVVMFQMLNEESTQPPDRRMMILRVGAFTIAMFVLGAAAYFFAFLPYANH